MESFIAAHNLTVEFEESKNLFGRTGRTIKAVDDVTLELTKGETLGIVGESGSGKSTLGRAILRLIPQTKGKIFFDGIDLQKLSDSEMRYLRKRMQIVFQDPNSSLNPKIKINRIIGEPLLVHKIVTKKEIRNKVAEILEMMELHPDDMEKYPHQFSGGQRQRIAIARALILKPDFIVFDEPVSALDLSIQAQILNLLSDLKRKYNFTSIFITHDIAVAGYVSDIIAVMYFGKIMEISRNLINNPRHPYTQMLLDAVPGQGRKRKKQSVKGEPPNMFEPQEGCIFRRRCPQAIEECSKIVPELKNGCACIMRI